MKHEGGGGAICFPRLIRPAGSAPHGRLERPCLVTYAGRLFLWCECTVNLYRIYASHVGRPGFSRQPRERFETGAPSIRFLSAPSSSLRGSVELADVFHVSDLLLLNASLDCQHPHAGRNKGSWDCRAVAVLHPPFRWLCGAFVRVCVCLWRAMGRLGSSVDRGSVFDKC